MKTLSLFSGAGGLDIGFHRAGFDIIGCVEIEKQYCETLKTNRDNGKYFNPEAKIYCEDIRSFKPEEFVNKKIECVIGGPPCQPFSAAGRRSGGVPGMQDDRGMLFESYCHVLEILRPRVFIFENVYGLKGANNGEAWDEISKSFSALGYSIKAEILDAADYGVPQHRERLILIGTLDTDFVFPEPTNGPDSRSGRPLVSIWDAINDIQNESKNVSEDIGGLYGHLLPLVPEGLNYSFFTKEMGYPEPYFAWRSKFHDFLYKADRNLPCRTLKAQPGKFTGPFHWNNRHFTIHELMRIQSFPDDYIITGTNTQIIAQIGNSVPPRLAEVLAVSVREQILRPVSKLTYPVREEFLQKIKDHIDVIRGKKASWYGLNLYEIEECVHLHEFCLISGEGGIGKSYFIKCFEERLETKNIPHLCLYGKFEKDIYNLDIEEIINDCKSGFVFIVDAVNEMSEKGQEDLFQVLVDIKKHSKVRIVITYRNNAMDADILKQYMEIASAEYAFPGVSFESALGEILKLSVPDVYKYEDILYSNNALLLSMLYGTIAI